MYLRLRKWDEGWFNELVEGWLDLFEEHGVEATVAQAREEHIDSFEELRSALYNALMNIDREDIAEEL